MQVRRLRTPEEFFAAHMIYNTCFHVRVNDLEEERASAAEDRSECWGTFDDDGTLMSFVVNNHLTTYFDGHPVMTGGIGGVSTLPEYRGRGASGAVFEKLLPAAYERGEVFSALFPFSEAFYRRFGYEVLCMQNDYTMKPEALAGYRFDGRAELWHPGDPLDEIMALYEDFAGRCSLAGVRTEDSMRREHVGRAYYRDRVYCYLLREGDEAVAFVVFQDDRVPGRGPILAVGDGAWKDGRGLRAILGFLSRFSADYETVEFYTPGNVELFSLIRSPKSFDIEKKTRHDFMARTVNVRRALELLANPCGASFTVRVADPLIPQNSGTWRVSADGVRETEEAPDIACGIGGFTQMVLGAVSLEEAALSDDVTLINAPEILRTVFRKKAILNRECF